MPPFSGQVQIAESEKYRAITLDGQVWEIQFVKRSHIRVATVRAGDIKAHSISTELVERGAVDEQIIELLSYIGDVELPFPATDKYEYWLLDVLDESPLALIYSCTEAEQMEKFPDRPEWTALPAAVMPVEKTEEENRNQSAPVNYQLERLVTERAGTIPKAQWFNRDEHETEIFPPLMIREDWPEESQMQLCQRYIQRQAPRLRMLHGLNHNYRKRLERCCRPHAMEVARFCGLYPEVVDKALIQALRVEARLRAATEGESQPALHKRRDGILYI
jgi:hypothetical protein